MQIDEADSIVWRKGVRLICTRLVETNLTPLHQSKECPWVPAEKDRP